MRAIGITLIAAALLLSYSRWRDGRYTWDSPIAFVAVGCLTLGILAIVLSV